MTASCSGRELPVRDAILQSSVEKTRKDLDEGGVPLFAATRFQASAGLVVTEPGPVRTIADHRIPRVRDRNDPRAERYRRAAKTVRVAGSIDALVVVANDRKVVSDAPQRKADPFAFGGMLTHPRELLLVQRSGLEEDRVGDGDLAEIVQDPAFVEQVVVL